jgi:DNA-binding SARP family transcriptional activator
MSAQMEHIHLPHPLRPLCPRIRPDPALAALQMRLLGAPQLWWHGTDLARTLPDKHQALLYVLGVEGQPVARTTLTRLLWGEWPDEAARANLRVALSQLRRVLPGALEIDARRVAFAGEGAAVVTDLDVLAQALQPGASAACRLAGTRVWRGELLAEFGLAGCDEFDRWCAVQRARAAGLALELQRGLMHASVAAGQPDAAMCHARALLRIDSADEAAHMVLMQGLAAQGERTAALRQYAACAAALADQFGARPSSCCYALYVRIHADAVPTRAALFDPMPASPGDAPAGPGPCGAAAMRVH